MINDKKYKILFVCLGNICRSPSAEAVMKYQVKREGLEEDFYVDSAGLSGWHSGEPADKRMRYHAERRGYDLTSLSRKFYPDADFPGFDLIIGMDAQNVRELRALAKNQEELDKIYKMTDFCQRFNYRDAVPDPYYGGADGFELVLDILEDGIEGLLAWVKKNNQE